MIEAKKGPPPKFDKIKRVRFVLTGTGISKHITLPALLELKFYDNILFLAEPEFGSNMVPVPSWKIRPYPTSMDGDLFW